MIKIRPEHEIKDPCVICLESYGNLQSIKCMGRHQFHPHCIYHYWNTKDIPECPLCRQQMRVIGELNRNGDNLQDIHEPNPSCNECNLDPRPSQRQILNSEIMHHLGIIIMTIALTYLTQVLSDSLSSL